MPLALYVTMNSGFPLQCDFYLYTGPLVGNPVLTAMTSQIWVTDQTSPPQSFPGGVRLKIAANMTSMTQTYQSR